MDISEDSKFPGVSDLPDNLKPPDPLEILRDLTLEEMMDFTNFDSFGAENIIDKPIKGTISFSKCVLYPPSAPPPKMPKLLGWKTVSICGFPKNTTEEMMKEIFGKCGEILAIRRDDNYYHIKFSSETAVLDATNLTGYRVKIDEQNNLSNNGQLFVHYGEGRDYENKYQQQPVQQEVVCGEPSEREILLPDPCPVVYSDYQAINLIKKCENNENESQRAVFVLKTWLDRGDCNKENSRYFFALIQAVISNVRQALTKKLMSKDKLKNTKSMFKEELQSMKQKFIDVEKAFTSAQKVLGSFTEAQHRDIQLFKKEVEDIKTACVQDLNDLIVGDEFSTHLKMHNSQTITDQFGSKIGLAEELDRLRAKTDILCYQLKELQINYATLKIDSYQKKKLNEMQLGVIQFGIEGTLKGIARYSEQKSKEAKLQKDKELAQESEEQSHDQDHLERNVQRQNLGVTSLNIDSSKSAAITEADVRLICIIVRYLQIQLSYISSDAISTYLLQQMHYTIQPSDVDSLLKKIPSIFKSKSVGASNMVEWSLHRFT